MYYSLLGMIGFNTTVYADEDVKLASTSWIDGLLENIGADGEYNQDSLRFYIDAVIADAPDVYYG